MKNNCFFGSPSVYNNLAIIYAKTGQKDKAYNYFLKAIEIKETSNIFDYALVGYYHNIAKLYEEDKKYTKAISYYLKKIRILKKLVRKETNYLDSLISAYYNIANLYTENNDYDNSIKYYCKGKELLRQNLNVDAVLKIVNINQMIISIYGEDSENSLHYYLENIELLKLYKNKDYQILLSHNYLMVGNYFYSTKNYKLAKEYYLENIKLREEMSNEDSLFSSNFLIVSYIHLLSLYYKTNDESNAIITKNKLENLINN